MRYLKRHFGMSTDDAQSLIVRLADSARSNDPDTERQIRRLREEMSSSQKEELAYMVLEVIAADKRKEASEMALLAKLIDGLGISDASMERAYARYFRDRD